MSARDEILQRVRHALRDQPAVSPVIRDYQTADDTAGRSPAAVADLLAERIADYSATVHRCPDGDVAAVVADALDRHGARRVVVPDGLEAAWLTQVTDVELVPGDSPLSAADLNAMDGVVTTCAAAIAETGTVILDSGPGQGRRALTLVPDYHLVLVPADRIFATVPAAIAAVDPSRALTWISGPSATSDIELSRVEGVHGPRTLEVIITSSA